MLGSAGAHLLADGVDQGRHGLLPGVQLEDLDAAEGLVLRRMRRGWCGGGQMQSGRAHELSE